MEAFRMDDSGKNPVLQYSGWISGGTIPKGDLASISKLGEGFRNTWTAELLYPPALPDDSTGMVKFLLGTWVPAPIDPLPCPPGLSRQYCDMQRSTSAQNAAAAKANQLKEAKANGLSEQEAIANLEQHLVFTSTEVIQSGVKIIPVTYSISNPTSVVLTLYDQAMRPTTEVCKRMPDDQLTCTRFVGLWRKVGGAVTVSK